MEKTIQQSIPSNDIEQSIAGNAIEQSIPSNTIKKLIRGITIEQSIPGFAEGGRPEPNKLSIVGEEGPELFVPDTAGTVIPNDISKKLVSLGVKGLLKKYLPVSADLEPHNSAIVGEKGPLFN